MEHALLDALTPELKIECAKDFLRCVDELGHKDNWRAKVQVHALIAACEDPSSTLGQSAKKGLWDFGRPSLKKIIDFVKQLADAAKP